ncbi:MAG: hypothetical protein NVSMB25_07390 [Thermoleophilaceae bacterium]
MNEDAARVLWADDYEFLRSRAQARIGSAGAGSDERATAETWRAEARSTASRRARNKEPQRPARPATLEAVDGGVAYDSMAPPGEPLSRRRRFAREPVAPPTPLSAQVGPRRRPTPPRSQVEPRRSAAPPRAYGSSMDLAPPQPYGSPYGGEPGRRTIQITGQLPARARQSAAPVERFAARPDRAAMWAVLLGLFLVLMAIVTAHG